MAEKQTKVLSSGVPGLDVILAGGFVEGNMFLIKGEPGTGKTTLSLQFLLEGIRQGEQCLYIGVGGAVKGMRTVADSFGWDLDDRYLSVHEVRRLTEDAIVAPKSRAFHPDDLDLGETVKEILEVLEKVQPKRLVIDSVAELRLICANEIEYRRMFNALEDALTRGNRTALITDYGGETTTELHLETLSQGCIILESWAQEFGKERRRLRILKYRGREVRSGWHDFVIKAGGIVAYPAIISREHEPRCFDPIVPSGNDTLDKIVGGGITCGTVTAIIGPSGAGKSTVATHYFVAAAAKGRKSAVYIFDETEESYLERAEGIGLPIKEYVKKGNILLRQLDVAELSPGEFGRQLIDLVEYESVSLVVIDSINGYVNSMRDEKLLLLQFHELLIVLNETGVTTFLTVGQHGMIAPTIGAHTIDLSYMSDNVILLRYFETQGEVRKAISVLKKRRGGHERTIRELTFTNAGMQLSEPLRQMHGILTGEPSLEQR